MKKILIAVILAIFSASSFCADKPQVKKSAVERVKAIEAGRQKIAAKAGGMIERPGSRSGRLVFFNSQNIVDNSNLLEVAAIFEEFTQVKVDVVYGKAGCPSEIKKEQKANLILLVIDDPKQPASLIALDDGWAIVNVNKIQDGLPNGPFKSVFLSARFRKEVIRIFAVLSGGSLSQFTGNIMSANKPSDLDAFDEFIPGDFLNKILRNYRSIGVTPPQFATYRSACHQGWAPAPTNAVQKAIWEKIHAMPTEPLKIKPETKKVRE